MKSFDLFRMALRRNKITAKKDKGSIWVTITDDAMFDRFVKTIASYRKNYGDNYFPIDWRNNAQAEVMNVEHGQYVEVPNRENALFDMAVAQLIASKEVKVRTPRAKAVNANNFPAFEDPGQVIEYVQTVFKDKFDIELINTTLPGVLDIPTRDLPEDASQAIIKSINYTWSNAANDSRRVRIQFAYGVDLYINMFQYRRRKNEWQLKISHVENPKSWACESVSVRNDKDVRVMEKVKKAFSTRLNKEPITRNIADRKTKWEQQQFELKMMQDVKVTADEQREILSNCGVRLPKYDLHSANSQVTINLKDFMEAIGETVDTNGSAFASVEERDRVYEILIHKLIGKQKYDSLQLERKMSQYMN